MSKLIFMLYSSYSMGAAAMNIQQEIEIHQGDIASFCRNHGVSRLEIFGSAIREVSPMDLDFLVEFEEFPAGEYAENYFIVLEYLEKLFNRPIDLLTPSSLKNPYFRKRVEQEKKLLYAA